MTLSERAEIWRAQAALMGREQLGINLRSFWNVKGPCVYGLVIYGVDWGKRNWGRIVCTLQGGLDWSRVLALLPPGFRVYISDNQYVFYVPEHVPELECMVESYVAAQTLLNMTREDLDDPE